MIAMPTDEYVRSLWNAPGLSRQNLDLIATYVPAIKLDATPTSGTQKMRASRHAKDGVADVYAPHWQHDQSRDVDDEYDPARPTMPQKNDEHMVQPLGRRSTGSQVSLQAKDHLAVIADTRRPKGHSSRPFSRIPCFKSGECARP